MNVTDRKVVVAIFLSSALASWVAAVAVNEVFIKDILSLPENASLTSVDGDTVVALGPENDGDTRQASRPSTRASRANKDLYVDAIVPRSIFDSSKVGAAATGEVAGSGEISDLKVTLMATVVSNDPQYSSALIADDSGQNAEGFGIDDDLLGEGKIIGIQPRKVYVERVDGTIEYIAMAEEVPDQPEPTGRSRGRGEGDEDGGVEKVGDNKWVIESSLLEGLLENPEQLYTQIRVIPHNNANGEIDGYRLSGIRRRSFFYKLGVKNGDVVHSVNGQALNSMSSAMEAYNSMANGSEFNFDITRRNQRQTFEYEVR